MLVTPEQEARKKIGLMLMAASWVVRSYKQANLATAKGIALCEDPLLLRDAHRRAYFEQMKGRGVRVLSDTEMEQVNSGVKRKTRYLIVDAMGVTECVHTESRPPEMKSTVTFDKLFDADCKQLRVVKLTDCTAEKVRTLRASSNEFCARWVDTSHTQMRCPVFQEQLLN